MILMIRWLNGSLATNHLVSTLCSSWCLNHISVMEERMDDGTPKIVSREPNINTTRRLQCSFQLITTWEFMDQIMCQSLIHRYNSIVKIYKTRERFKMGAYWWTITRTQTIYVYMTLCRTSSDQDHPNTEDALTQKRSPSTIATLPTIVAIHVISRQALPTMSPSVRVTDRGANK